MNRSLIRGSLTSVDVFTEIYDYYKLGNWDAEFEFWRRTSETCIMAKMGTATPTARVYHNEQLHATFKYQV